MPSIEEAARFASDDPECDNAVLALCLRAAMAWYEKAGIPAHDGDDLYDFWVYNLTAWFYDNRGAGGAQANVPPYIVHSVHQLRRPRQEATP